MPDILFAPGPERIATTNAWAFLRGLPHAAAAADGPAVWAALRQAFAANRAGTAAAFAVFAGIPATQSRLGLPPGPAPAVILHKRAGPPRPFRPDDLIRPAPDLPASLAAALARPWDPRQLLALRAGLLLHLDLRPDDVVLLAGLPPAAWLPALIDGTRLILADPAAAELLPLAAATGATVLAAPAGRIAEAAFPSRDRPALGSLRSLIALGGPMAPAARARVYAWIKPDLMLLARAGNRYWGTPLSPVHARPVAEPALFRPSPGGRAPRSGGGVRAGSPGSSDGDHADD